MVLCMPAGTCVLVVLIDSLHASQVAGIVCVYTGDCFPAIQNMSNMKGSVQVFPKVKQLYESAARADLLLDFVWKPRTDADLVYTDELSRMVDNSEILLAQFAFVGWSVLGSAYTRLFCRACNRSASSRLFL